MFWNTYICISIKKVFDRLLNKIINLGKSSSKGGRKRRGQAEATQHGGIFIEN